MFESAAIVTAIADLVPEKDLIAKPGTWSRNLHYQWVCFVLTEMEAYVHSTEINSMEDRFSVTDIIVGYTISWGQEQGLLSEFPNLLAYLEHLLEREHCTAVSTGRCKSI